MTSPQGPDDEAQLARIAPRGRRARAVLLMLGGPFLLIAFIIGGRLLLPVKELRLAPLVPFEAGVADEAPRSLLDAPMIAVPGGPLPPGSSHQDAGPPPVIAPFALDPTEVTVRNFRTCVEARRCAVEADLAGCNWSKPGREDHPMNCVDWNEADIYCRWLGRRLPTEEEWELAARGAPGRVYPWGDDPAITERACVARGETCAVGSFPGGATPQGLLDLAGNVWEWTSSPYCPANNPGCDAAQRAVRGGSYSVREAAKLRATIRSGHPVTLREHYLGFRCARDGAPTPGASASSHSPASSPSPTLPAPATTTDASATPTPSASGTPWAPEPAWVGLFRAALSDPFLDEERKTRYRVRHALLQVTPEGAFRVRIAEQKPEDMNSSAGCETRGHLRQDGPRLVAVEEATSCPALGRPPRELELQLTTSGPCLLRWHHPKGGLSGGLLELSGRREGCLLTLTRPDARQTSRGGRGLQAQGGCPGERRGSQSTTFPRASRRISQQASRRPRSCVRPRRTRDFMAGKDTPRRSAACRWVMPSSSVRVSASR